MASTRPGEVTISSDHLIATNQAVGRMPKSVAFRLDALPLEIDDGTLVVALHDPEDANVLDQLRMATRVRIRAVAMPRDLIRERLRDAYSTSDPSASANERRTDAPAVRAVDSMFERAIRSHASDIHVEPLHDGSGRIRIRIDGILRAIETVPAALLGSFVSRIKLVAAMDIADKRQPQDGRYSVGYEGRTIDARVSSVPTIDGERIVIRLLDENATAPNLATLGMPPDVLAAYRRMVHAPWGFVVVTGPTGSGKTTTLYASLAELDSESKNICSVEDPIEMRVDGVAQVQVSTRSGLTFPAVLRSFMRQDPNVIMVGEMRDAETASVAISASLAGQLVFTTLHSNDAPRTIERLVELGVARHALAAGLTAVVAQRLVRTLCEHCKAREVIPETIRRAVDFGSAQWYVARGCRVCSNTGFVGRIGVYELLKIDDIVRDAIASGGSSVQIGKLGRESGYRPMALDGLEKVKSGVTSFEELSRVVAWEQVG